MLVLTRRVGEAILIGDNVSVTIHALNDHQVRIGIDAPKTTKILRSELADRALPEPSALKDQASHA